MNTVLNWYIRNCTSSVLGVSYKVITTMVIRPPDDDPHDLLNLWSLIYNPNIWGTWESGIG